MAEATALRNNALDYPVYGAPWGVVFPILDADGDPVTGAASLDSERSLNGDTFSDCTNEATEIATASGVYYLLFTATELTTDVFVAIVKTATAGAKTTTITLYPRKLPTVRAGTSASAGSATSTIVLDSGASPNNDYYNGMLVIATIDSVVEARIISDYVGSTKTATVVPDWNTAPDNNDTFVIMLPDGRPVFEQYLDGSEFFPVDAHRQKWENIGSDHHVYKPDDTTETAYSPQTLATDPAADPITGAS